MSLGKSFSWMALSNMIGLIIQLTQTVIMAKFLTPSDYGLWAFALLFITFSQIFSDFGLTAPIIQKKDISNQEISTIHWVIFISCFCCSIVFFITPHILPIGSQLTQILYILGFGILINGLHQTKTALLQKEKKFRALAKINIVSGISAFLTSTTLLYLGHGPISMAYGFIISITITFILISLFYKKSVSLRYFNPGHIIEMLRFGLYQIGERLTNFLSTKLDQFIIASFANSTILGIYVFASNLIITPLSKSTSTINGIMFSYFSNSNLTTEDIQKTYKTLLNVLSLAIIPAMLGLFVTSEDIIMNFFGPKWIDAIPVFKIFCIIGIVRSLTSPISTIILSQGKAKLNFLWNISFIFFQIIITAIMVYLKPDALGISIAVCICYTVNFLAHIKLLSKPMINLGYNQYIKASTPPLIIALIMAAIVYIIEIHAPNTLMFLIINILIGITIYIGLTTLTMPHYYKNLKDFFAKGKE